MQVLKTTLWFPHFDLKLISNRCKVPVRKNTSVTVTARLAEGTWDDVGATLSVKWVGEGTGPVAFASAKTIAAGGGSIRISSSELEGIAELWVILDTVETDASPVFCDISAAVEEYLP